MGEILEHLHVQEDMPMVPALILSSDSHVFEPPDLWTTRIDAAFRDRAPRMQRIDGVDQLVVEGQQAVSGIGLISNAGARFEAPETISSHGRFEDVPRGGYDPGQHLRDMQLDGIAGEVLYPSQGLFYFKVADPPLLSAIFRAYNEWLAEFCRADPARLKGLLPRDVDVRHDLLGCLRALSPPQARHRGIRAGLGPAPALHHGLHVSRAPRRGALPIQGRHAPERLLPPQRLPELPGGRH